MRLSCSLVWPWASLFSLSPELLHLRSGEGQGVFQCFPFFNE